MPLHMKRTIFLFLIFASILVRAQSSGNASFTPIRKLTIPQLITKDTMQVFIGNYTSVPQSNMAWKGNSCFNNVKGNVHLSVRDSGVCMPDTFSTIVRLQVRYGTSTNQDLTEIILLSVNYDKRSGKTYSEKSGRIFNDAHYMNVKLLGFTNASANAYLDIALEINSEQTVCIGPLMPTSKSFIQKTELINNNNDIKVSFRDETPTDKNLLAEADEFDVEWTTIDVNQVDYASSKTTSTNLTSYRCTYNFKNNATRVTIGKNQKSLIIKNIFEDNIVLFRYRRVTYYTDTQGELVRITSSWSTDKSAGGTIDDADAGSFLIWTSSSTNSLLSYLNNLEDEVNSYVNISTANATHLPQMNWQYLAVYAEEAKCKETINYFDGSLRSRQTVTTNNSDNTILAQENVYDFMGRAAIQILPVPIVDGELTYQGGLNINSGSQAYSAYDFDKDNQTSSCEADLPILASTAGASKYYSVSNPYKSIASTYSSFVPLAEGYPFTQTVFMPDNTGRVRAKSGVGKKHQITATGKYTEYAYETPSQNELNRLFGTEVGYAEHYKKASVIDANGQPSVSYTDLKGKTIATALAAQVSNGLSNLESNVPRTGV